MRSSVRRQDDSLVVPRETGYARPIACGQFESYRKTLVTEEVRRAFDDRIESLLSKRGVDYVRGYVDALENTPFRI